MKTFMVISSHYKILKKKQKKSPRAGRLGGLGIFHKKELFYALPCLGAGSAIIRRTHAVFFSTKAWGYGWWVQSNIDKGLWGFPPSKIL